MGEWDGQDYQRRFDDLAASGASVHGEVDHVMAYAPRTVLDAGCGTGRVAIELARRGVATTGVDPDASMIATARALAPELEWWEASMVGLDLGRTFDLVVMAGNVPLFTPAGTQAELIAGCARHLAPGGRLVSGFQLGRGYSTADLDAHTTRAGLVREHRWSTWDRDEFSPSSDYVVSVHRRPAEGTDVGDVPAGDAIPSRPG